MNTPDRAAKSRQIAGILSCVKAPIDDPLSAFLCILDGGTLQHIRDCTVDEAHRVEEDSSWDVSVAELKAFIAMLFVRGTYNKNIKMESFWSEEWGLPFFNATMSRDRYREIMRYTCALTRKRVGACVSPRTSLR